MKNRLFLPVLLAALLCAAGAVAETVAGLPLHVQKLGDGVIRVWIGDHISSTASVAFATEKGVLVVDTFGNPKVDAELREVIARELGRDDFVYLVNTHEHGDHTGGNAVYADCTIVGHEQVAAHMTREGEEVAGIVEWLTGRIAEEEAELAEMDTDSPEAGRTRESMTLHRLELEVWRAGETPPAPTKTFHDRMTLDLGDTTFELYYIGGMHSSSDIAIFVPEHGLLMTGDTMADTWLPIL